MSEYGEIYEEFESEIANDELKGCPRVLLGQLYLLYQFARRYQNDADEAAELISKFLEEREAFHKKAAGNA